MSAHHLHLYRANVPGNRTVQHSEYLAPLWVGALRSAYRTLRREGVHPTVARMVIHSAYTAGSAATGQHEHVRWLTEHRERVA